MCLLLLQLLLRLPRGTSSDEIVAQLSDLGGFNGGTGEVKLVQVVLKTILLLVLPRLLDHLQLVNVLDVTSLNCADLLVVQPQLDNLVGKIGVVWFQQRAEVLDRLVLAPVLFSFGDVRVGGISPTNSSAMS